MKDVNSDNWLWLIWSIVFLQLTIFLCTVFAFVFAIIGIPNAFVFNFEPFKLALDIFLVPYLYIIDNFKKVF